MGRGAFTTVVVLASIAAMPAPVLSQPPAVESGIPLVDRVLAATVSVACGAEGGSFSGSGIVISPVGHVLTAASAVPAGATDVTVLLTGYDRRPATVVATDESLGVTLLRVAGPRSATWPSPPPTSTT
jgi:S1-C subfamily serine protease